MKHRICNFNCIEINRLDSFILNFKLIGNIVIFNKLIFKKNCPLY